MTSGSRGDAAVAEYLTEHGHTILDRNWRCGHLELDIVSMDKLGLHFVEVKTRSSDEALAPQEAVGAVKMKRLSAAAKMYLSRKGSRLGGSEVFFDIAAVLDRDNHLEINYFPNAFLPLGDSFL